MHVACMQLVCFETASVMYSINTLTKDTLPSG